MPKSETHTGCRLVQRGILAISSCRSAMRLAPSDTTQASRQTRIHDDTLAPGQFFGRPHPAGSGLRQGEPELCARGTNNKNTGKHNIPPFYNKNVAKKNTNPFDSCLDSSKLKHANTTFTKLCDSYQIYQDVHRCIKRTIGSSTSLYSHCIQLHWARTRPLYTSKPCIATRWHLRMKEHQKHPTSIP